MRRFGDPTRHWGPSLKQGHRGRFDGDCDDLSIFTCCDREVTASRQHTPEVYLTSAPTRLREAVWTLWTFR